ncbi:MAG: molybdopterin-guanine dinucleotide biosynthesis protein B [Candidatus Bathyarchaeota archaeon]|nr:molybdopterin-guanine dinucleotide biosynthesis protein B [Candidatus Bathyarchaeota archaeon]
MVKNVLNIPAIVIFGRKKSGKTSLIEAIIKRFTDKGFKVGYVKHIPHPDFTIDKEGKDSWRAAKAGAKIVVCISPKEISIIKKGGEFNNSFRNVTILVEEIGRVENNVDFLIFEGFGRLLKDDDEIPKLIIINEDNELKFVEEFKNVLGVIGPETLQAEKTHMKILSFNKIEEILEFVEEKVKFFSILKKHPMFDCGLCKFKNCFEHARAVYEGRANMNSCVALVEGVAIVKVDEKRIPLNKFTSEVVKRTILGLVSTLKGVDVKGNEVVEISLKKRTEKFS